MNQLTILQNKHLFGDEQVLATRMHPFQCKKGISKKPDSLFMSKLWKQSSMIYHYDAEHNPAFLQVCTTLFIHNQRKNKIAVLNKKDGYKTLAFSFHITDPGCQSFTEGAGFVTNKSGQLFNLEWVKPPVFWGVAHSASSVPDMHLHLFYHGTAKNVKSIVSGQFEWMSREECMRRIRHFDHVSQLVIDHYYVRGSFNANHQTRRKNSSLSA